MNYWLINRNQVDAILWENEQWTISLGKKISVDNYWKIPCLIPCVLRVEDVNDEHITVLVGLPFCTWIFYYFCRWILSRVCSMWKMWFVYCVSPCDGRADWSVLELVCMVRSYVQLFQRKNPPNYSSMTRHFKGKFVTGMGVENLIRNTRHLWRMGGFSSGTTVAADAFLYLTL